MPIRVCRTSDPGFRDTFKGLLRQLSLEEGLQAPSARDEDSPQDIVRRIIGDVRTRGDQALIELTEKLDGCRLTPERLRVSPAEIEAAYNRCDSELLDAMELAADRIRRYQESILVPDPQPLTMDGRMTGVRYTPVDAAGLCVPGAAASLASSVLMNAVPARVAGVERLAMVTPPDGEGRISDDRLAAARVAGVDEIYRVGGSQAVAALAYGTDTIEPVDIIAGPGNIYVTLAKRAVFGRVGIDGLPGPSEVVVIADGAADPDAVASDLLAQAEHAPGASILLTPDEQTCRRVLGALAVQLAELSREESTRACLERYSLAVVCGDMDECVALSDEVAPEHLQISTEDSRAVAEQVRHAGAIFIGHWTPVACGDYIAGPSHTLPTSRTARFSSGLSANTFRKRSSLVSYERRALAGDAEDLERLALAEGLDAHARSVRIRLKQPDEQNG